MSAEEIRPLVEVLAVVALAITVPTSIAWVFVAYSSK